MGELLKPRVLTKEQARQKRDDDIAEAHARYDRRIKHIDEQDAEMKRRLEGGEPQLPIRAVNSLRWLLGEEELNRWGRMERLFFEGPITPEAASKLTAGQILNLPNAGHKTVSEIATWLRFHGYDLKP